ncbi:hypothetical protein [Algoriphagus aquimarinus]|uniref:TraB/GumN family protein n=1 Tax=Algoriphagus aquimarinus TaxID=237018 RepID=A0A5C7B0G5_9BACT|nr:hypothetical protein [Algoriphagus aquimarinus]TXE13463.1 hypothetical protein ESV85_05680 [Algoriphagus aquimarinus]
MNHSPQNITFISTVHKEIGMCNAEELACILSEEHPDVVFLEALPETYSDYDKMTFSSFGVYHANLEIKALQLFSSRSLVEYVPVLNSGWSELFELKYNQVCENPEFRKMLEEFNALVGELGIKFLNSDDSVKLQQRIRMLEDIILNDKDLKARFNIELDAYEDSMLNNIYSFCRNNQFEKAVFMCGVAHRKSLIEKIQSYNSKDTSNLNWTTLGN